MFKKVFCISLEHDIEKRERTTKQLSKLQIPFEFHNACYGREHLLIDEQHVVPFGSEKGKWACNEFFVGPNARFIFDEWNKHMLVGEYGCIQSHIDVAKKAKELKLDGYLVLEDDVGISEDFWERIDLLEKEWPEDADIVFLGNIIHGKKLPNEKYKHSTHLWKIKTIKIQATHAFIVRANAYDKLIERWGEFDDIADNKLIDTCKSGELNGYVMLPYVTYQRDEYSEVNQTKNKEGKKKLRKMPQTRILYSEDSDISHAFGWEGKDDIDFSKKKTLQTEKELQFNGGNSDQKNKKLF
jgi:GR25 family glycosyltransferase involved in LPS biosynthesis